MLDFHNAGFAEDDLRLVVEYIKRVNKKREWSYHMPLRFGKLVGDLEYFGDVAGEARADKRARDHKAQHSYTPTKASVLRATGRSDAPTVPDGCISARDALRQIRESL